jgi:hypothetical protein
MSRGSGVHRTTKRFGMTGVTQLAYSEDGMEAWSFRSRRAEAGELERATLPGWSHE